ncbi:MAG: hypothetical protein ACLTSX_13645 [Collinsella sp.]
MENFDNFAGNAETLPRAHVPLRTPRTTRREKNDANYLLDTKLAAQLQYLVDNNYYYPSTPRCEPSPIPTATTTRTPGRPCEEAWGTVRFHHREPPPR